MRAFIVILFLLILVPKIEACEEWTTTNTTLEWIHEGLVVIDYMQTRAFVAFGHPEMNPLLGEHPSPAQINERIALGLVTHYLISCWLSPKERLIWQGLNIGIEFWAVENNAAIMTSYNISW